MKVSSESIRQEFQKFLEAARKQFITESHATKTVSVNKVPVINNPLMIQIEELSLIYDSFKPETGFWFAEHVDAVDLIKSHPVTVSADHTAELLIRYQGLDSVAWKIRLDTLWIRTQQILLETEIDSLRQQMNQNTDHAIIQELQQKLISLHTKKEALIRSLAE